MRNRQPPAGVFGLLLMTAWLAACASSFIFRDPPEVIVVEDIDGKVQNVASLASRLICTNVVVPGSPGAGTRADAIAELPPGCLPCVPHEAASDAALARRHADRLHAQTRRGPYNNTDYGPVCASAALQIAALVDSTNREYKIDLALHRLWAENDSVRALGLTVLDSLLTAIVAAGDSATAMALYEQLGREMWDRAQRMYMRPPNVPADDREKAVNNLRRGAPRLTRLPPLPRASDRLGESVATWASALLLSAQAFANNAADSARLRRLSMAPYVVFGQWRALDSVALAILAHEPRDSVAAPAHALARYYQLRRSVLEYPAVMAAFDSALRYMPRVDSLTHDTFDDVFDAADDEWRYGFFPGVRLQLEQRAWAVIDPLWITPVNELRMARRARIVEANFRYAHLARPATSGVETPPGVLLMKGGSPTPTWQVMSRRIPVTFQYEWPGFATERMVPNATELWPLFYRDDWTPAAQARRSMPGSDICPPYATDRRVFQCARHKRAEWRDVVFQYGLDTIDVALARFRAPHDSSDLYIASRLPLRSFRHRGENSVNRTDSIRYGVFVATSLGKLLYSNTIVRRMPRDNEIDWVEQWQTRVGDGNIMHRVEAADLRWGRGARGAALLTSAEAAMLQLRGFGMSDILVAERAAPRSQVVDTWRDLEVTPNAGVVEPRGSVGLVWEVYDLQPDDNDIVQWRVSIRREGANARTNIDARSLIIGSPGAGTKVVASEPDASQLSFTRIEKARPVVVDYLSFNLADAPRGRHVLVVTIEDLVAKRSVTRSVSLRVMPRVNQRTRNPTRYFASSYTGWNLPGTLIRRTIVPRFSR